MSEKHDETEDKIPPKRLPGDEEEAIQIDSSLQLCEMHTSGSGDLCPNYGTRDSARVRYVCTICKNRTRRPIELTAVDHRAVISFYDDHGIDLRWDVDDIEGSIRMMDRLWALAHTLGSTDSARIRVTVPCENEDLRLILDEDRTVTEVRENT